jgi:hypothetical protein
MMPILDSVAFWASALKLTYLNFNFNLSLLDFEVITAVSMKTTDRIVESCSLVRAREPESPTRIYRLHLLGRRAGLSADSAGFLLGFIFYAERWKRYVQPKRLTSSELHDVGTQETVIFFAILYLTLKNVLSR